MLNNEYTQSFYHIKNATQKKGGGVVLKMIINYIKEFAIID